MQALDNKPPLSLPVREVVDFIWNNRKDSNAFKGYETKDDLAVYLSKKEYGYLVSSGVNGITGIVVYKEKPCSVLYILQILITTRQALRNFAREFRKQYPGWQLEARRRDKIRFYHKTDRLVAKLMK